MNSCVGRVTRHVIMSIVVFLLASGAARAQSYQALHQFLLGDTSNGSSPFDALIQGTDGNFYGTTGGGGTSGNGIVFKMVPSGAITVLHSFTYADGSLPKGSLVQGTDGFLYGTTQGVVLDFGPAYGLCQYTNDSVWIQLHSLSAAGLVMGRFY